MAQHFDTYDEALVIDGWENGIARNPYEGISDSRNVNLYSVPGEAAVGFSTGSLSLVVSNGTITSLAQSSGTVCAYSGAANLENVMAIRFTSVGSYSGITASGTNIYWVSSVSGGAFKLYSDWDTSTLVNIAGSGDAGFTVYSPDFTNYQGFQPTRFVRTRTGKMYLIDSIGRVWGDKYTTPSGYWTYSGNARHNDLSASAGNSNGNGIAYYEAADLTGYVFAFSDSAIDYIKNATNETWKYAWNPSTGTNGVANYGNQQLNTGKGSALSHDSILGQDNIIYYCDANFIGSFFEKSGQTFDPTSTATYTWAKQALKLPTIETAQCLTELGTTLLIGGRRNYVYPWDRLSTSFSFPIFLSEYVVQKMITVNTNAFIFVGNRGRIYITNGSQAEPWVKVPDHLSGTVEPYFTWGDATFNKNQLYFSVAATDNAGNANTNYGAIWNVDFSTKAMRVVNQLSYGSYAGLATALFPITPLLLNGSGVINNPPGSGLYIGWCSGSVIGTGSAMSFSGGTSGIDKTTSNPYVGSQSYIDTDLIPIGTFDKPRNFSRIIYLLTKPLVSGESIKLQYRTDFSQSFTDIDTDSTAGNFTNSFPVNFQNAKWVQIRIVLNSTLTNPSYVRLKQIRLTATSH